jgi:hypothetical protein
MKPVRRFHFDGTLVRFAGNLRTRRRRLASDRADRVAAPDGPRSLLEQERIALVGDDNRGDEAARTFGDLLEVQLDQRIARLHLAAGRAQRPESCPAEGDSVESDMDQQFRTVREA